MKREATGLGGANMWLYAGLIIGCAAIFAGIILLSEKDTHFLAGLDDAVPNIRYGGDAYTGIQNAAAYTGNAVAALYKLLSTCFGLTFLFFGLVDICVFARKIQMAQSCVCADEPEEAGQEACAESTAAEVSGQ